MKTKTTNLGDDDMEDGSEDDNGNYGEESNDPVVQTNDNSNTSRNPTTTVDAFAVGLNDPRHGKRKKNQTEKTSRKRQKKN